MIQIKGIEVGVEAGVLVIEEGIEKEGVEVETEVEVEVEVEVEIEAEVEINIRRIMKKK